MNISRSLTSIAPALVLTAALAFLFFKTQQDIAQTHDAFAKNLYEAAYFDSRVLREIVVAQESRAVSFDELVLSMDQLNQSLAKAEKSLSLSDYGASIEAQFEELHKMLHERAEIIEEFKSTSAIFRNSLSRIPEILEALHKARQFSSKSDLEKEALIRQKATDIDALLVRFIALPTTDQGQRLIDDWNAEQKALSVDSKTPIFDQVLLHIPVLTKSQMRQQELKERILNIDVKEAIGKIHASYEAWYEIDMRRSAQVRWLLFLLCVALIPYALYAIRKQRNLNSTLDAKVMDRTKALVALNTELRREIDERIKAQQLLLDSSKMAALGEMAGGVAHEINNPLGVIDLRARHILRLLKTEPLQKDRIQEFTNIIVDTVGRIAKIVHGLKTFSRDGSKDPLIKTDLSVLISESTAFCIERFKNHGIDLTIEPIPADLNAILCRPVQVSQVFVNILNNAHDAIRHLPEPRWVRIAVANTHDLVEIAITDCGSGIPEPIRNKLFQPFFSTKEVGSGTGLGLSISMAIIKSNHGQLYVDDTCKNTRFVIRLPKCDESISECGLS